MTQKKEKLSLNQLTITSFTTKLDNVLDLRGGAANNEEVQGSFVVCTGTGDFATNCTDC